MICDGCEMPLDGIDSISFSGTKCFCSDDCMDRSCRAMKWIKCKDRMPEKDQAVLVWWPDKYRKMIGTNEPYVIKGGVGQNKLIQHNGNPKSLWWSSISSFEAFPPTHWMPLPDKPVE